MGRGQRQRFGALGGLLFCVDIVKQVRPSATQLKNPRLGHRIRPLRNRLRLDTEDLRHSRRAATNDVEKFFFGHDWSAL